MKSTDSFKQTISQHLEGLAATDALFAETLKKENKNIDECVNYILTTVQKSGCNGFTDEEVFGMAVHYYDEDDLKGGKPIKCNVVVNHTVELSQGEIQAARQSAIDKVIEDERARMTKKAAPKPTAQPIAQSTLFD